MNTSNAPPIQPRPGDIPPRLPPDGAAIASFVCGLISLVLFCSPLLAAGAGIPGLVCGLLSKTRGGLRMAGIALSVAGMCLSLFWLGVTLVLASRAAGESGP